jgi:hypothetical protein
MKCLFIGGSYDGTWKEILGDRPDILLPKTEFEPIRLDTPPPLVVDIKTELYRELPFLAGNQYSETFRLFVIDGMSPTEVATRLIKYYKRS